MFISKQEVVSVVTEAIEKRNILFIKYQHTSDGKVVRHKIAPFDIGSTNSNPKIREKNANNLYAYSFTHLDNKTNKLDPKVCGFDINNLLEISFADEMFDEKELAILNLQSTKYDYRNCKFALLPNRNWFPK